MQDIISELLNHTAELAFNKWYSLMYDTKRVVLTQKHRFCIFAISY